MDEIQQNPARQFSSWLDSLTRPIVQPVASSVGEFSKFIGGFISPEQVQRFGQVGEEAVHAMPRTIGEAAMTFGKRHPAVRALGLGDVALRSFAHTQPEESTGEKIKKTALGTAGFLAMPAAGAVGRRVTERVLPEFSPPLARALATGTGGAVAAGGAGLAQQTLEGQENVMDPANLYGTALNVLPFEAMGSLKAFRARQAELRSTDVFQASWMDWNGKPRTMEFEDQGEATEFSNRLGNSGIQVQVEPMGKINRPKLTPFVKESVFGQQELFPEEDVNKPPVLPPEYTQDKLIRLRKEMQMSGMDDLGQLEQATRRFRELKPEPGETPLQTVARSAGVDPKLFGRMKPEEVLDRAYDYGVRRFYHMGESLERADYLARQMLFPIARMQQWLGKTAFASMPPNTEASKLFYGFKQIGGEAPQYLMGILDFEKHRFAKNYQDPSTVLFHAMHAVAHESVHNMIHEAISPEGTSTLEQRQAIRNAYAAVHSMQPWERVGVMGDLLRMVLPEQYRKSFSKANLDRYGDEPDEFLVDFGAMLALGATNHSSLKNMQDIVKFSDADTQNFTNAVYRDVASVWNGVKDWVQHVYTKQGLMAEGKRLAERTTTIQENLSSLMKTREEAQESINAFLAHADRRLSGPMDPPPSITMEQAIDMTRKIGEIERGVKSALGTLADESQFTDTLNEMRANIFPSESKKPFAGERMSFLDYIKPMQQLVASKERTMPTTRQFMDLGVMFRSMVHNFQFDAWKNLWVDPETGKADWRRMEWLKKSGSTQNKAFNKIALVENERSQDAGYTLDNGRLMSRREKEEASPDYARLSEEEKGKVDLSLAQMADIRRLGASMELKSFRDSVTVGLARYMQFSNKELQSDEALSLAERLTRLAFDFNETRKDYSVFPDPMRYQQEFAELMAELPLTDQQKQNLIGIASKNFNAWYKLGDQLMGPEKPTASGGLERPGLLFSLPEVRYLDWQIAFKEKGDDKVHLEHFRTRQLAAKRRDEIQESGGQILKEYNRSDLLDAVRGKADKLSSATAEAEQILFNSIMEKLERENPDFEEAFNRLKEEYQPGTAKQELLTSPYMKDREFMPGREQLDFVEGMVRYVDAATHRFAKRYVKERGNLLWNNKDMRANPDIRKNFTDYLRFVTEGEGREWSLFNNYLFFHFLGLNPSSAVVEWTQQLTTLVPHMVRLGMPIGGAYRLLKKTQTDVLDSNLNNGGKMKDPVEEEVRQKGLKDRTIDVGFSGDLYSAEDFNFAKSRSLFAGNDKLADTYDMIRKPLYQLMAFSRHAYGMFTRNNSQVALLTAFRHFKSLGQDNEQAYLNAKHVNDVTMYAGGRAARPMMLQKMGNWSGAGGAMYMLQSFMLNTLAMQGRLAKEALGRAPITKEQQHAAQKAVGLMLGTQAVLAGVMGLPVMAPAAAVIQQVTGVDVKRDLLEAVMSMFQDDKDMGHTVADGALHGLFNLTGIDFGSRLALANFLGVSPYDGFNWKNVAGPGGSMIESWMKGAKEASSGHWYDAIANAAPVALRNMVKLHHDDMVVRDKAGRLLYEPTGGEKAAMGLGFKPTFVARYYEKQRMLEASEERMSRQLKDLRTDVAGKIVKGDMEGARQAIVSGLKDHTQYDPRQLVREAVDLAVQMQAPYEQHLTSRANVEDATKISQLFQTAKSGGELDRVLQQSKLERQLGLPFARPPSLRTLSMARFVDRYMAENPGVPSALARLAADQMYNRAYRRRTSLAQFLSE